MGAATRRGSAPTAPAEPTIEIRSRKLDALGLIGLLAKFRDSDERYAQIDDKILLASVRKALKSQDALVLAAAGGSGITSATDAFSAALDDVRREVPLAVGRETARRAEMDRKRAARDQEAALIQEKWLKTNPIVPHDSLSVLVRLAAEDEALLRRYAADLQDPTHPFDSAVDLEEMVGQALALGMRCKEREMFETRERTDKADDIKVSSEGGRLFRLTLSRSALVFIGRYGLVVSSRDEPEALGFKLDDTLSDIMGDGLALIDHIVNGYTEARWTVTVVGPKEVRKIVACSLLTDAEFQETLEAADRRLALQAAEVARALKKDEKAKSRRAA